MTTEGNWAADEFRCVDLGDKRLTKRLIRVVGRLADAPQRSIPAAREGWDETQATDRLFQNEKVTMESILEPHAESTMRRVAKESTVLVLQDTTELDFTSKRKKNHNAGPLNYEDRVGFYLHSSMVVTRCAGRSKQKWKAAWQIRKKERPPQTPPRLGDMLTIIASLGGHLGRKCDGPPGPKSIWIGLHRLADFAIAWNTFGPNNQ